MSKAIVRIDIPDDYADEYKEWLIEGTLYYLEDGVWMYFKDAEYFVEPYREAISVEWIERKLAEHWYVDYDIREMLKDWEKENERLDR